MNNKNKYITMIKKLISSLEGAPFPTSLNDELYQIWYEHSRQVANEALELIVKQGDAPESGEVVLP